MTNNQIESIINQANSNLNSDQPEPSALAFKSVEIAVRDVLDIIDSAIQENRRTFYQLSETADFGPALVSRGALFQSEKLLQSIKLHFGLDNETN